MSAGRRKRLEAVNGWAWDGRDALWDESFAALATYTQVEGHTRIPRSGSTRDLGNWVASQRYQADDLSAERRERLEALTGWVWGAS